MKKIAGSRLLVAGLLLIALLCAACGGGAGGNVFLPPPVQAQAIAQGSILYGVCETPNQGGPNGLGGLSIWMMPDNRNCGSGASNTPGPGVLLTSNGRLINLRFKATTTVALTATVYVNRGAILLQCTIMPGGNLCSGPAAGVPVFDLDEVVIGVTPAGAGTFSNLRVSVEKQ